VASQPPDLILLLGSLVAFYIASRAAVDALALNHPPSPARQAIGHAVPIAAMAFGAAATGHAQLAVGVLFSTSVAALTLVAALSMLGASSPAVKSHSAWALVLPAALLAWLAGFAGHLAWIGAIALLLEGIVIAAAWNGAGTETGKPEVELTREVTARRISPLSILQLILAIALAAIGVWMTLRVSAYLFRQTYFITEGLFAAAVVSPILVLPMIGLGVAQAQRGQLDIALGAQVGVVLLNICLLLPLTAGIWWIFYRHQGYLIIPLGVWRIDNMALIVLGLFLLCLTMRLWQPGKIQGIILLIAYVVYLGLSLVAAVGR
jgi:Ca2+/Na+ antiporter